LALLVFEPKTFAHFPDKSAVLKGRIQWVELRYDLTEFLGFLDQVMTLLSGASPRHTPNCPYEAYVSRRVAHMFAPDESLTSVAD